MLNGLSVGALIKVSITLVSRSMCCCHPPPELMNWQRTRPSEVAPISFLNCFPSAGEGRELFFELPEPTDLTTFAPLAFNPSRRRLPCCSVVEVERRSLIFFTA